MNLPSDRLVVFLLNMLIIFFHVTKRAQCSQLVFRKKIADAVMEAISYLDKFEKSVKDCLEI